MKILYTLAWVCLFGVSILHAQDAIDPASLQVVGGSPDVRSWRPTAAITRVTLWEGNVEVDAIIPNWPEQVPPGWDGPIQFTLWIVVQKDGVWRATGSLEFWKGKTQTGSPLSSGLKDWWYYAPEIGQPQPGEVVGLFIAAGDQRRKDMRTVTERSNIVAFRVPANDTGSFDFAVVPPSVPPVITPPPVVVPPPVGVPPPPPIIVTPPDLSGVTSRLDQIAQQLAAHDVAESEREQRLTAVINQPAFIARIFENRYVQLILAGVGTYLTTHQMMK